MVRQHVVRVAGLSFLHMLLWRLVDGEEQVHDQALNLDHAVDVVGLLLDDLPAAVGQQVVRLNQRGETVSFRLVVCVCVCMCVYVCVCVCVCM
jgi:DhnA family fructose-bisphosphate aldolase class Ia